MIPNAKARTIQSSGVSATTSFGISRGDEAHLMTILRDTLYSDKILAVLREYSANAWDAHKMVGKDTLPIKIKLPTSMDPTLVIQDFGPGLSHDDVFEIYTQYGASTKRTDNKAVGMLGIGSKSGFAYSDSFTITSCHGGKRRVYTAVLDASEKGTISLLHEEDCGDETGVSISLAVKPRDVEEFHSKAKRLYQYFEPRPEVNTVLPEPPKIKQKLKHGVIYEDVDYEHRGWVAVMGCIPYRVDVDQLRGFGGTKGIPQYISNLSGARFFNIRDVQIAASREELKYSDETKKALVKKLNDVTDEYVTHLLAEVKGQALTDWEKRLKVKALGALGLPIPKDIAALEETFLPLKAMPKSLSISKMKTRTQDPQVNKGIGIHASTRLLLRDDVRALAGYSLGPYDYIVRTLPGAEWDEAEKELDEIIKKLGLEGIPKVKMSTLPWAQPLRNTGKKFNAKHKMKTFVFKPSKANVYRMPYSDYWEADEIEPSEEDVWVVIKNFQGETYNFFQHHGEDSQLAEAFGGTLPRVYGYKSTEKSPVDRSKLEGTEYSKWRNTWVKTLVNPTSIEVLDHWYWASVVNSHYYGFDELAKKGLKRLDELYGETHLITTLFRKHVEGMKFLNQKKINRGLVEAFHSRLINASNKKNDDTPANRALAAIFDQYPLLALNSSSLTYLWGSDAKAWGDYVKLIDALREGIL